MGHDDEYLVVERGLSIYMQPYAKLTLSLRPVVPQMEMSRDGRQFQPATFKCLISAVPPCASSSMRNMSVDSLAIASAMSLSIFKPLATVACSGAPYHPVSAIVRISVN